MDNKKKGYFFNKFMKFINLEGLVITGKYIFYLILAAISIEFIVSNINYLHDHLAKVIIYCSLPLIPLWISYKNMLEMGFEFKDFFINICLILIIVSIFYLEWF